MQRIIILICLFLSAGIAQSQQVKLDKAEKMIEDGFYEKALSLTEDALENEVTKKNPLTYYLHAIALFNMTKDESFARKNPEAFKEACKMVIKAKQKDKEKRYEDTYKDFVAELVAANNALAEEEYNVNRYPKAIKFYTISYNINGDKNAYYMIGKSYQMAKDTASAKTHYRIYIEWFDEAKKGGDNEAKPNVEPYLFMTDIHWKKRNYDSANYYLDRARYVLGEKNSKINFYQYMLSKDQITNQPPSSLMMEVIRKAMVYNPSDTFLVKKENALMIYLIRNAIDGPNQMETDSMIFRFARAKALKASDPAFESLKTVDIFLQPFAENVLWKMSDYYYTNTHDKASAYIAKKYIIKTANPKDTVVPTDKEIIARWIKIIEFAKENEAPGYVTLLMTQASTDYPTSKEIAALKKKLLMK